MQDLTLIIPAKNEPESLPYILIELEKLNLNYIIIMEKTDFVTINSIEKFKSKIIFQNNKGYGDALIKGLQNVKTKYCSVIWSDQIYLSISTIKKTMNFTKIKIDESKIGYN